MTAPGPVRVGPPDDGPTAAPPPAPAVLPAGPRPGRPGAAVCVGLTLAALTAAAGVAGVRDALVRADVVAGSSWLAPAVDAVDGLRPQWWGVPLGLASVVAGLLLLAFVRPRPRATIELGSRTGVEIRRRAVGRLAVRAAEDVAGVLSARARVRRGRVEVSARVTGEPAATGDEVERMVRSRLAGLRPPPTVRVVARTEAAR